MFFFDVYWYFVGYDQVIDAIGILSIMVKFIDVYLHFDGYDQVYWGLLTICQLRSVSLKVIDLLSIMVYVGS